MAFKKAVKYGSKLRLGLTGPSGSGKSYTLLTLGCELARLCGGRAAAGDTEHGSLSKYAHIFDFDCEELTPPYHPSRFIKLIRQAETGGYPVLILDSLSHAWAGPGGILEMVDSKKGTGNSFAAWKDMTPIQNELVEAILASKLHILCAMRQKTEWTLEVNERGKQVPRKVGLAPVQRGEIEYEFDVFGEMSTDNTLHIDITRVSELKGVHIHKPGIELAHQLYEWLQGETRPVALQSVPDRAEEPSGEFPAVSQLSVEQRCKNARAKLLLRGTQVCGDEASFYVWLMDEDLAPVDPAKKRCSLTALGDDEQALASLETIRLALNAKQAAKQVAV